MYIYTEKRNIVWATERPRGYGKTSGDGTSSGLRKDLWARERLPGYGTSSGLRKDFRASERPPGYGTSSGPRNDLRATEHPPGYGTTSGLRNDLWVKSRDATKTTSTLLWEEDDISEAKTWPILSFFSGCNLFCDARASDGNIKLRSLRGRRLVTSHEPPPVPPVRRWKSI